MSVSVTMNGVSYTIPETGDTNWGAQVTAWIQQASSGTLQKSGGSFILTAEVDFGATYGLKSAYFKSKTTNAAGAGVVRLANADAIAFRNSGNTNDISLTPGASDGLLNYNSVPLVGTTLTQTLTNKTLTAPVISSPTGLVKADVGLGNVDNTSDATKNAATATLTNKTLTAPVINSPTGLVKADVGLGNVDNTSDATKNAASVTLTNKTIVATANTISAISNTNIDAAAAIARTKLASGTASHVLINDGSGVMSSEAFVALSRGGTGISAGSANAAFNNLSPMTTGGDLIYGGASGVATRLANGSLGQALLSGGGTAAPSWGTPGNNLSVTSKTTTYTVTTSDDLILCATSSAWTLTLYTAVGNSGKQVRVKKTSADTNILSIVGTSSQTMDGQTTIRLFEQHEEIIFVSDGANWVILEWRFGITTLSSSFTVAAWPITVSQYGDLTSITVGPGTWALSFHVFSDNIGAVTTGEIQVGIGTVSGNSGTGTSTATNLVSNGPVNTTSGASRDFALAGFEVSVTASTVYYLKGIASTSVTNLRAAGRLTARRVGGY